VQHVKNVSHVFLDFQKTFKKRNHLVMQPSLITQLPEVRTVSHGHQHQTSCSDVWTQEKNMQLRTVCYKCL